MWVKFRVRFSTIRRLETLFILDCSVVFRCLLVFVFCFFIFIVVYKFEINKNKSIGRLEPRFILPTRVHMSTKSVRDILLRTKSHHSSKHSPSIHSPGHRSQWRRNGSRLWPSHSERRATAHEAAPFAPEAATKSRWSPTVKKGVNQKNQNQSTKRSFQH